MNPSWVTGVENLLDVLAEMLLDDLVHHCALVNSSVTREQAETMLATIGTQIALRQLRRPL